MRVKTAVLSQVTSVCVLKTGSCDPQHIAETPEGNALLEGDDRVAELLRKLMIITTEDHAAGSIFEILAKLPGTVQTLLQMQQLPRIELSLAARRCSLGIPAKSTIGAALCGLLRPGPCIALLSRLQHLFMLTEPSLTPSLFVDAVQDDEVVMALLDMMNHAGMLDGSAYNAAETIARWALAEHRDTLMDGPIEIRKAYKELIGLHSAMPGVAYDLQILLRFAYLQEYETSSSF